MRLVVFLAVTSGFEREFQDRVLALNSHLTVDYGRNRISRPRSGDREALRACRRRPDGKVLFLAAR